MKVKKANPRKLMKINENQPSLSFSAETSLGLNNHTGFGSNDKNNNNNISEIPIKDYVSLTPNLDKLSGHGLLPKNFSIFDDVVFISTYSLKNYLTGSRKQMK